MPEQTFRTFSRGVVESFLQTVVVLDDGAYMTPDDAVLDVVEPDETVSIPEEVEPAEPAEPPHAPNALDAQALIGSFAARGLVCGVLLPWKGDDASAATLAASRRADIVILDWQLGDEGEKATEIIRTLIQEDAAAGGRLRMLAVYTASPDLEAVRAKVGDVLQDFEAVAGNSGTLALKAQHARIVFIRKGITSEVAGTVAEPDLAGRLIDEFVELGRGLLANVALGSIASIRDETHRVLARFHPGLDAPFLTHRILLVTPEDAEGYAIDLLTSEFQSILQGRGLGRINAGREVIHSALKEVQAAGGQFRLMSARNSTANPVVVSIDDLMKLVDAGPEGLADIANVSGNKSAQAGLYQRVYLLLSDNVPAGLAAHHEFARVSAHARERGSVDPEWRARLDLGSIVRAGDEYLVCIQPTCDALRLTEAAQFIFASLSVNGSEFDVVVKNAEGTDVCLKLDAQASRIRTVSFAPDVETGAILSSGAAHDFKFTSVGDEAFVWICDLRTSFAQRFVHRIANNLSRIGLDEFEWQRRHAPTGA
jgi:hypothetical protein